VGCSIEDVFGQLGRWPGQMQPTFKKWGTLPGSTSVPFSMEEYSQLLLWDEFAEAAATVDYLVEVSVFKAEQAGARCQIQTYMCHDINNQLHIGLNASDDKASTSPVVLARNNSKTASRHSHSATVIVIQLDYSALRSMAVSDVAPCWRPSASPISYIKKCNLQESHNAVETLCPSSHELFLVAQSPSGEMVTLSLKCYHQPAMAVLQSGRPLKVRQSEQH